MKIYHSAIIRLSRRLGFLLLLIASGLTLAACGSSPRESRPVVIDSTLSTPTRTPSPTPSAVPSTTALANTPVASSTPSPTRTPNPYAAEFAAVSKAFKQNFTDLQTINPDIKAWIEIKAAGINHPVLLGVDNEYYLDIGFDNKPAPMGSIYFDQRYNTDMTDQNVVIYGHNWDNGRMFSNLVRFRNKRFLAENPEFYLYTPTAIYRAQLAAVMIVKNDDPSLLFPNFETEEKLKEYLTKLNTKAELRTKIVLNESDRFLSLYTCTNNANDDRIVIISKLIEIGRYQ
jgi:sortase B